MSEMNLDKQIRIEALSLAVKMRVADKVEDNKKIVAIAAYFEKFIHEGSK